MLPNPAHASRPRWYVRDYPGAAARAHAPPAFSRAAAPGFLNAHWVTGERWDRVSGPAMRAEGSGSAPEGLLQSWFCMNEPLPCTRYLTSDINPFLEQSGDTGGGKGSPSHLFSATQPSQSPVARGSCKWPEAGALPPAPLPSPPQQWVQVERAPGWWPMEPFRKHTVMKSHLQLMRQWVEHTPHQM